MHSEERWIELETKIAYQDHTIEALHAVVLDVRSEMDRLKRRLEELQGRVDSGSQEIGPANDRPPHW